MTLGQGAEASLIVDIAFWSIAVSSVVAAIAVVQLRDVFQGGPVPYCVFCRRGRHVRDVEG